MKCGDEIHLELESFAFEGKSVARVEGLVVFVLGGVPGDEVRARLTKVKKQFAEATVVEVLAASALRVTPRCRYFGTCGGCKWQDVAYQAQLDFKRQHVIDSLERIGGCKEVFVHPTLGVDVPYFYRNKMEFSFGNRWLTTAEMTSRQGSNGVARDQFSLGMHISGRFDKVLDLEECFLQSEISYRIVNAIRSFCPERDLTIYSTFTHTGYLRNLVIRQSKHTGELMVNLVTSEDRHPLMEQLSTVLLREFPAITTIVNNITERKSQVATGDWEKVYYGPGYITERIGHRTYRISANSFFQTHTAQAERLYATARRMAELKKSDVVFDLYSGTGSIALFLADDVREVVGIEVVESAIEDARRNATMNDVSNCTFVLGDLKDKLTKDTEWLSNHSSPDVVIVDPPRAGMHDKVIRELLNLEPRRIVYVSCNPATQARDVKLLCADSAYVITDVQPVDMFPHTYHIENVLSLSHVPQC